MNGFLIAAPQSGSGKTLVTLALLRALQRRGFRVASAKAGPDYIDPAFHEAASGAPSINLDPWAMRAETLTALFQHQSRDCDFMVVEGMMGLHDGAADGTGSAADLALAVGLPIVFVVDCSRMSQSIAALVSGYERHRAGLEFAGVILNRVGGERHEKMLRDALTQTEIPVLGVVRLDADLVLPSRHLGLVQAGEHAALETFIDRASNTLEQGMDFDLLVRRTQISGEADATNAHAEALPPLGQRIAIASDEAFSFIYPHVVNGWRSAGAEISFFSPLADETPTREADAIYLPGGYPELHAARISDAATFRDGMRSAGKGGVTIYGECGGYMVLGKALVDSAGTHHAMLDMLDLVTRFDERKRQLGYRRIEASGPFPLGRRFRGHEFHYSTISHEAGTPLFEATDAVEQSIGSCGLRDGSVFGSFMHLIDVERDGVQT